METYTLTPLSNSFSAYSFDVFDTVLTRCFKEPEDLFREVGQRLILEGVCASEFGVLRTQAEFKCRERSQFLTEVSLDEIYQELANGWAHSPDSLEKAKFLELQLERHSIVEHRPMLTMIDRLRCSEKKIIFVSDIYLPEDFVRGLLIELGILKDQDLLYVSSTYGKMKAWGDLFDVVLKSTGIPAHDICHVGDSFRSDVEQAHSRGLHAIHAKRLLATRYEKLVPQGNTIAAKLAGAARATRAQNPYLAGRSSVIWDTTAQVAGPLLFAFAAWCMVRARIHGVDQLFFLARDGQIIKRIADVIGGACPNLAIPSQYLYVSRQSLLFPGMVSLAKENFDWILARTHGLTLRDVLQRIRFNTNELSISRHLIDKWGGIDAPLDDHAITEMESVLYENKALIDERAAAHRQVVLQYLGQEGFLESSRVGLVDVGWNGTLQRALSNMRRGASSSQKIFGQYFGIRKKPNIDPEYDSFEGWFSSPEHLAQIETKAYIVPMIELFTAADHGGTTGYQKNSGRVEPTLRSARNVRALDWGLSVQHEATLAFARNALRVIREDEFSELPELSKVYSNALLEEFILRPTSEEAKAYCAYEDAEDQNEVRYNKLGRPYDRKELSLYFSKDYMHHHNEWRQGALAITEASLVDFAWRMHCAGSAA
jgi:predicted HAD superfamily hydrolase